MAAITTRQTAGTGATVAGVPLTNTQLDTNFINLNTDIINHKYHAFSDNQYFFDGYEQGNYFRLFTENALSDNVRFGAVQDVEYWNGTAWVVMPSGAAFIQNLLDGREETIRPVDHTYKKFRFTVTKNSGWPTKTLIVLQSTWSAIVYTPVTVTIEGSTQVSGGTWTVRDTSTFGSGTSGNTWGVHAKVTSSLHTGEVYNRITIDITDWADVTTYTTYPLVNFSIYSNYSGTAKQPWTWNYNKVVDFQATPTVNGTSIVTNSGSWGISVTGTSANVTGTVAVGNGGTGQTTIQAAINSLAGGVTSGQYLRGNGTNVVMSAIQVADVPTLNQNTTGSAGSAGLLNWTDIRTINPTNTGAGTLRFGFTSWTNNNSTPYADYLHLRSYTDSSGGNDNLIMFRKDAIGMRIWQQTFGSSTAYATYKDVAFTDGTGASGTWGISVTGNAGTVTNGVYTSGSYADPAWITSLSKSKVGLGNVENTALSTWAGSTNITTIGATAATSLTASGIVRSTSATHNVQLGTDAGGSISIGRTDNVASAPYIDFNSGATSTDFDVRLAATGGNGTAGNGTLALSGTLGVTNKVGIGTNSPVEKLDIVVADSEVGTRWVAATARARIRPFVTGSGTIIDSLNTQESAFQPLTLRGSTLNLLGNNGTGASIDASGNLTLAGNLIVNGTTITVNSTVVTIDDTIFTLGGDTAPTLDDNKDRGIEFRWHNGTTAKLGFFGFDDSTGYLTFIPDATNTSEVFSGTLGDIQATNFRGALIGNASTATTLQTARTINGVSFNGSSNIVVPGDWTHSSRDFPNGTLVETTIDYSQTAGDPWILEIRGNSYGSTNFIPFEIQYQGYIYTDTIIHHGGYSVGTSLSGLVLFNYNGKLCFWWPYQVYWHGYNIRVYSANAGYTGNRVTSITNVAKPVSITKEVALSASIRQVLRSDNFNSYSPTLTGTGASGTWGISVTGSAGSVAWANVSGRPTAVSSFTNDSGYITSSYSGFMLRSTSVQANPNTNFVSSAYRFDPNANNPTNEHYAIVTYGNESNVVGQLATHFTSGQTFTRAYNSAWSSWRTQLDSSNYNSYSPSLTGTGASGTWGISITGSAASNVLKAGDTMSGDLIFSNGRKGLVGAYNASQTQAIFAMGSSYRLTDGGASNVYGDFYGIAWSYDPDYGGTGNNPQSKSGLAHQLLIMNAGVTKTAIGNGIWTSGAISQNGNQVLHAGNYTSYSPSLTGSGASGTWGINITGNAATSTNADTVDNLHATNLVRNFGLVQVNPNGSNATLTTAQFITWLTNLGAFNFTASVMKCTWDYAGNNDISDTGFGQLELAGCVIEVFGDTATYIIRITSPSTGTGAGGVHEYINHGAGYSPGWRRPLNTNNYTTYSPTLTGTGASGTWNISISGNSATATNVAWSGITSKPTTLSGFGITDALSSGGGTITGNLLIVNTEPVLVLRDSNNSGSGVGQTGWISYQDSTGTERAWIGYGSASSTDLNINNGRGDVKANNSIIVTASNYNSYSPTLTGTGASGTWSISVTGTAGNVTGTVAVANGGTGVTSSTGTGSVVLSTTPTFIGTRETRVTMGANDINLNTGNLFTKTISGATTLTVSNVPAAGTSVSFILDLTNGGSAAITWWSGMKWTGGTAPTLTASGRDVLGFFTHDGGTTWTGLVLGKDVK
jgi:hypothetical protein